MPRSVGSTRAAASPASRPSRRDPYRDHVRLPVAPTSCQSGAPRSLIPPKDFSDARSNARRTNEAATSRAKSSQGVLGSHPPLRTQPIPARKRPRNLTRDTHRRTPTGTNRLPQSVGHNWLPDCSFAPKRHGRRGSNGSPANSLVEGRYLCRREGIERKDAGERPHARGRALAPAKGQIWRRCGPVRAAPSGGA